MPLNFLENQAYNLAARGLAVYRRSLRETDDPAARAFTLENMAILKNRIKELDEKRGQ